MTLLDVTDLSVSRLSGRRPVQAVQPVSFTLEPGETLGLLGEAGSGADLVARAVAGVATGGDVAGSVLFEGRDLLALSERELRKLREVDIGLLLPEAPGSRRPGGRAAPALPPQPKLLVVDTGGADLDEGVGELIRRLQADAQTAVVILTRDLVALADLTDLVIEMYAGKPVEFADGRVLTHRPHHPYTAAVVTGMPLRGPAPAPGARPAGCPFHPRCPYVMDRCLAEEPPPRALGPGGHHRSACWLPLELVGVDADVALRRGQATSAGRAGTPATAPQVEAGHPDVVVGQQGRDQDGCEELGTHEAVEGDGQRRQTAQQHTREDTREDDRKACREAPDHETCCAEQDGRCAAAP